MLFEPDDVFQYVKRLLSKLILAKASVLPPLDIDWHMIINVFYKIVHILRFSSRLSIRLICPISLMSVE
jgi:hypothetical protein